jgi:hypothetical protein
VSVNKFGNPGSERMTGPNFTDMFVNLVLNQSQTRKSEMPLISFRARAAFFGGDVSWRLSDGAKGRASLNRVWSETNE